MQAGWKAVENEGGPVKQDIRRLAKGVAARRHEEMASWRKTGAAKTKKRNRKTSGCRWAAKK